MQNNALRVYFIRSKTPPYGPLKDFRLLVEIGQGPEPDDVFRDRDKIETFAREMIEKFMLQNLIYPNAFVLDNLSKLIEDQIHPKKDSKS